MGGNPIAISCIVNWRVVDPKKALMNVEKVSQYVNTNAQAVLKQTVSHYTYDQIKGIQPRQRSNDEAAATIGRHRRRRGNLDVAQRSRVCVGGRRGDAQEAAGSSAGGGSNPDC